MQVKTRKMVNYVWGGSRHEKSVLEGRRDSDVQIDHSTWTWGRKTNRTI